MRSASGACPMPQWPRPSRAPTWRWRSAPNGVSVTIEVHQQLGVRRGVGADVLDELVDDREPVVAEELVLGHWAGW